MSKDTRRILERIRALEIEKAKLLPLRKEEIFNVLEKCNGLTIDNKLLAGLAIYANNPANADSSFLRELAELGKSKIPSNRNRSVTSKANKRVAVQQDTNTQKKAYG